MTPPERLREVAVTAGDERLPGLWVSSRTARLQTYRDMLRQLGDRTDTSACLARSEIAAGAFAELKEAPDDGQ
jgi:hypothetical protein